MAFYDTTEPYELLFEEPSVSLVVQLRRSQLILDDAKIENYLAVRLEPLAGHQAFLESQFDAADTCGPAEASHRGHCTAHLLNAVLTHSAAGAVPALDADLFDGAKRYALAHISEPELRPEDVARANFMSVRSLQRAFAPGNVICIVGEVMEFTSYSNLIIIYIKCITTEYCSIPARLWGVGTASRITSDAPISLSWRCPDQLTIHDR